MYKPHPPVICFEGLDRSGKGTQVTLLSRFLTSLGITHTVVPAPYRDNATGALINQALSNSVQLPPLSLHHLFISNRHEVYPTILANLSIGQPVILDRWVTSGQAYSLAQNLDPTVVMTSDHQLIRPDITFYLSGDPSFFAKRAGYGGEVYEKLDFQIAVSHYYTKLKDTTWITLDATVPPDQLHLQIREHLADLPLPTRIDLY